MELTQEQGHLSFPAAHEKENQKLFLMDTAQQLYPEPRAIKKAFWILFFRQDKDRAQARGPGLYRLGLKMSVFYTLNNHKKISQNFKSEKCFKECKALYLCGLGKIVQ